MRRLERIKLVSTFDHEPLIGSILRNGTLASAALIVMGLTWRWIGTGRLGFEDALEGTNVLGFLLADLRRLASMGWWSPLFLHLGIAVLFLIPYARTLASLWYFAYVERNARFTLLTGCICAVMTYILLLG